MSAWVRVTLSLSLTHVLEAPPPQKKKIKKNWWLCIFSCCTCAGKANWRLITWTNIHCILHPWANFCSSVQFSWTFSYDYSQFCFTLRMFGRFCKPWVTIWVQIIRKVTFDSMKHTVRMMMNRYCWQSLEQIKNLDLVMEKEKNIFWRQQTDMLFWVKLKYETLEFNLWQQHLQIDFHLHLL